MLPAPKEKNKIERPQPMLRKIITATLTIPVIFFCGCSLPSLSPQNEPDRLSRTMRPAKGRIYDCAANSLYGLCRKSNIEISYNECLELLPHTSEGNSMLDFKGALMSLGFKVEAVKLTADEFAGLQVPAVVLVLPPPEARLGPHQSTLGHYLVLWPLDDRAFEILDHPREPVRISRDYWVRHLRMTKIETLPVLLCGRQGQSLNEMLTLPESTAKEIKTEGNRALKVPVGP